MKFAHTINDVAELLSDYQVSLALGDDSTVVFDFPTTEEEKKAIKDNQRWVDNNYGNYKNSTKSIEMSRQTRYVVRSLVGNPRFRRLTTVAQQLNSFQLKNNKQETKYGKIRVVKKSNSPLHIVFTKQLFAKRFFSDVQKSKLFKKVKV